MKRPIAVLALAALAACGKDMTAPLTPSLSAHLGMEGDWYAASVNGVPLPITFIGKDGITTVVERRLTLTGSAGTWHDVTWTRYFRRIDYTIAWSLTGNQVVVQSTTPGFPNFALSFTVDGETLVNTDPDGKIVIYRKR